MPKNQNAKLSPSQLRGKRKKTMLVMAAILAALILPPVILAAMFHPGAPNALCKACHEMRAPYHAWTGAQHKDTPCDECHKAPSVARMFMAKMERRSKNDTSPIKTHVAQANCLACHKGKIKQNLIVVNGIKFSHEKHFSSEVACLTCHKNTGHNPEPAAAMLGESGRANCLACHNDLHGKGSSDCSACHAPSGFQLTSVTGKDLKQAGIKQPHHRNANEQNQDCSKCHSRQYCWGCHVTQNPHPAQGFDHVKESKANGRLCTQCHDFDFCTDCHTIKKQHTANKEFNGKGHAMYADKIASCEGAACHTEQFCNKCHNKLGSSLKMAGGEVMHPASFIKQHPLFASRKEDSSKCLECHENNFCIACHQGRTVHPEGWSMGHAKHLQALSQGKPRTADDECTSCHTTPFCSTCHKKSSAIVAPSHPANFKQTHKKDPSSKTGLCKSCHSQGSCSGAGCHQAVTLPHTPAFNKGGHKNPAMTQTKECAKCHGPAFCMDCHKTGAPADHKPADWYKGHKKAVEANKPYCNLCHDNKQFCGACHKSGKVVTHTGNWDTQGHLKTNKASDLASCAQCHRQDSCSRTCHSKAEIAKRSPKENHLSCYKCHVDFQWKLAGSGACTQCHPDPAAQGNDSRHEDCAACHNVHEKTTDSCASAACHAEIPGLLPKDHKDAKCVTCHMAKAPAGKKSMGHDWNSKALFSNCTTSGCHKNIKTLGLHKIKAHNRCGDCHEAHSAKTLKFDTACLKCHKPKDFKKLCVTKGIDCEDWK